MNCPCTMGECACPPEKQAERFADEMARYFAETDAICVESGGVCQRVPCLCKEGADAKEGW